ncbi:MAG TPA: hypothetical protein DEA55_10860 [Rhodospirillaceae bacterium]|nr:hypothetical protein [Rhodospirillaceae bacterium]
MVMPGILPRAKALFASGFGYLAFLMANVYNMVRLLPPTHPYLNPANIGKFGIRHVIAEAANNLVVDKKNIDQLLIFSALLISIVLLLVQIILLVWSVVFQPAMAYSMFTITTPFNDLAYMLLDSVFGVPNMFNSCVAMAGLCPNALAPSPAFPTPFHTALHSLFQYYSIGMLLIGVLIFLYFAVVVVVETAVSGAPFGQRFASVWAPIRLVVAIGLLIPFNYGLNSAQYIVLYAAKFGSNLASNAWIDFNSGVAAKSAASGGGFDNANNPLGEHDSLVALPKQQDASVPVQFMSLVHTCAYIQNLRKPPTPPFVGSPPTNYVTDTSAPIRPYLVKHNYAFLSDTRPYMEVLPATTHVEALDFYDNGDIIIRFGIYDPVLYKNEMGNVYPTCGDIRIKVTDVSEKGQGGTVGGPDYILERYFSLVKQMWFNDTRLRDFGVRIAGLNMQSAAQYACTVGCGPADRLPSCTVVAPLINAPCGFQMPAADWKQDVTNGYQTLFNNFTNIAWYNYAISGANFAIQAQIIERGWAGAGMWYNRIAQVNGAFITAVMNTPTIDAYPKVMEDIRTENRKSNSKVSLENQFRPNLSGEKPTQISGGEEALQLGTALNAAYEYWNKGGANMADPEKIIKGNIFTDAINMMFGTGGLFAMRNENLHTHPLAQLVGLGKGLVESTIRNMTIASVSAFLGGMGAAMDPHSALGALGEGMGKLFASWAFIGLTAGAVLYYVLPFLPFVYFYFAVGSWLKTIFEAMVGVPLWALAHLRIDGHGLPGDSAMNGYFLIFDIFVRPILTVFGLIASITIFTAQVRALNIIWDMVTNNIAGFNDTPNFYTVIGPIEFKRAEVDQFFFTIIYAMVVYMLATASFKLIDKIPDGVLRWMGSGVSTFSDINQDPTESLTKYAALGGVSVSQQISGTAVQTAGQLGRMVGK